MISTNQKLVFEYESKFPFRYQRAIRRADGRVSDEDDAEAEDDDGLGINDRSLLLGAAAAFTIGSFAKLAKFF